MKRHIEEGKIALLAGGDLDPGKASGLAGHLAECSACSALLERYREGKEAISAIREFGIEAGDCDAVRQSVLARIQGKQVSRLESFTLRRFGALQWGALAAGALVAISLAMWRWRSTPAAQVSEPAGPAGTAQVGRTPVAGEIHPRPVVAPVTQQSSAQKVNGRPQAPSRGVPIDRSLQGARVRDSLVTPEPQPPVPDDVLVKLETSDPNVIIIWLASQKGAAR
jgi:anti-sigma factor RsiW